MSARSRELFGLVPVSLLITAGFTAVYISRQNELSSATLTYGGVFLLLWVVEGRSRRAETT